jgi:MFS transporter, DHA1 family, tetracycline resistance protein
MKSSKHTSIFFALFLAILIDGAGMGLFFPILNGVIMNPHQGILAPSVSMHTRDLLYGTILSSFMLAWFFGAALFGDISDNIGRKKSLIICLLGSAGGYLLAAISVIFHSITLMIVSRIIDGFTSGSQPIAQAAIIDISSDADKTKNLGRIMLGASLGFIIGPLLGAFFSNSHLVSWFNYSTPLFVAFIILLANAGILALVFKETRPVIAHHRVHLTRAFTLFVDGFKHKAIRNISIIFLLFILGWSNYFAYISMFLFKVFNYDTTIVGLFWAVLAVGFAIGTGFFVNVSQRWFNNKHAIVFNLSILGLCILLTALIHNPIVAWLGTLIIGTVCGASYTIILGVFSSKVSENKQGWVMGISGSISALCFGVMIFFGGFIANINISLPFIIGAGAILISIVWTLLTEKTT